MPEATLLAFADHGSAADLLAPDGGTSADDLAAFRSAGIDPDALGQRLQDDGADAFVESWRSLTQRLETKSNQLLAAR